MICVVAALLASGVGGSKVYDAGYWPQRITSPDGKFFVQNYEGEGAVPYIAVYKVGKGSRQRFATFSDVTTFVWAGRKHVLLVGTQNMYDEGFVYEWSGERLPMETDGDTSADEARVIYRPPWNSESDEFETRILSVNGKIGTVRIRAARMDQNGDYTLSRHIASVRF
jgi:hypothetical protein